jgi:hypothetical protein
MCEPTLNLFQRGSIRKHYRQRAISIMARSQVFVAIAIPCSLWGSFHSPPHSLVCRCCATFRLSPSAARMVHHRFLSGCRFSRKSTGGGGEPGLEPLTVRCVDSPSSKGVSQKGSRPLKALSVATLPALLVRPKAGHFYVMFESRIRNKYNRSSGTSM